MSKEYFMFVNGTRVVVKKEVYLAYWQQKNRENYLKQLDRKNQLLFFSDLDKDGNFEENLEDKSVDVAKLVEIKERKEALTKAISRLSLEEREVIEALYFREETLRAVARKNNISHPALIKRRNKILEKLKKLLLDI